MLFDDFVKKSLEYWSRYFRFLAGEVRDGRVAGPPGSDRHLLPNMAVFTNCDHHFVMEFIGAQPEFRSLRHKKIREGGPVQDYFDLFASGGDAGLVPIGRNGNVTLTGACLMDSGDEEAIVNRFPFVQQYGHRLVRAYEASGALITLTPDATIAALNDVALINKQGDFYRAKRVNFCCAINGKLNWPAIKALYDG
jgi:hypothetical protein